MDPILAFVVVCGVLFLFLNSLMIRIHMQNIHNFDDTQEAGTQTDVSMEQTFQKSDVMKLINESFDVFQNYMKMKMEPLGVESKEMIKEGIDVSKYILRKKLCG